VRRPRITINTTSCSSRSISTASRSFRSICSLSKRFAGLQDAQAREWVHGFGQSLERQGRNGIDVLSRPYATLQHHHAADVLRWPFGKQSCPVSSWIAAETIAVRAPAPPITPRNHAGKVFRAIVSSARLLSRSPTGRSVCEQAGSAAALTPDIHETALSLPLLQ
jgi:hypothetical protein